MFKEQFTGSSQRSWLYDFPLSKLLIPIKEDIMDLREMDATELVARRNSGKNRVVKSIDASSELEKRYRNEPCQ